jgi:Protein of unknown function (DUF3383)
MSLDSIVNITIDTKSLQLVQAGFGIPLIIAPVDELKESRIKIFKDPSELSFLGDKSASYQMAKTLMAQNPRISLAKIGYRLRNESIEQAFDAIINEDADFYGVLLVDQYGDDHKSYKEEVVSLAGTIASKRFLAGIDIDEHQLPLAEELKAKSYSNIFLSYKAAADEYLSAALMGKMLPKTPGSSSWAFKELMDIRPQKINLALCEKLKSLNINRYIGISGQGLSLEGKVAKGEYIDVVHGRAWLQVRIQERLFRLFMLNDKIPFTSKGLDLVRCEISSQLSAAVDRGFLAADPKPEVFIPSLEDIDPIAREKRILPDVTFSARAAGAIHEIEIRGTISF